MPEADKIRILGVDDERGLCAGVQEALQREGYTVDAVTEARTALSWLAERPYNLVLTDVRMPDLSGLELLREARHAGSDALFIVMTAFGTVENAVEAMKEGAYDYLSKPLDMRRLRVVVRKALEYQCLISENSALRQRLRKRSEPSLLPGSSDAMRQALRTAD